MEAIGQVLTDGGFEPFVPHADGMEFARVLPVLRQCGMNDQEAGQILHQAIFALDIYQVAIDGSSPPTPVVRNVVDKYPTSLSPDGSTLAYREASSGRNRTLLLSLEGNGSSHVFGDTTVSSFDAAYSPDGAWIAYSEGDFSGLSNVFVRRADGSGGRTQISVGGGKKPLWTKGGREIVFQKGNGLYAVDVDAPSDVVGVPTMLFEGSYNVARGYDVTADGSRFLIVKPEKRPEALPILVIMNFFEELKAKVGGN